MLSVRPVWSLLFIDSYYTATIDGIPLIKHILPSWSSHPVSAAFSKVQTWWPRRPDHRATRSKPRHSTFFSLTYDTKSKTRCDKDGRWATGSYKLDWLSFGQRLIIKSLVKLLSALELKTSTTLQTINEGSHNRSLPLHEHGLLLPTSCTQPFQCWLWRSPTNRSFDRLYRHCHISLYYLEAWVSNKCNDYVQAGALHFTSLHSTSSRQPHLCLFHSVTDRTGHHMSSTMHSPSIFAKRYGPCTPSRRHKYFREFSLPHKLQLSL